MWSSDSDADLAVAGVRLSPSSSSSSSSSTTTISPPQSPPPALKSRRHRRRKKSSSSAASTPPAREEKPEPEAEDVWRGAQWEAAWPGRHHAKPVVVLAAEDDGNGGDGVGRSRSLTDDDLEELKGCADLGFGFSYDEIPELRGTLPALELCYSMSQRLLDDHHHHTPPPTSQAPQAAAAEDAAAAATPAPPVTNWKISSPGDSPDEVKARLKYWAQAVACTVRLCS
ncbi:hypothetical protein EJB05_02893 [Eragrostis curvula]|uniref:Uncharacterized protein n=1 Tax=Eragrostis curvula TaxID=38414 RepID=A0A5J9WTR3_9POAL|nr:hypothetical protein EJB05_02893 [Eragrostis curvula]